MAGEPDSGERLEGTILDKRYRIDRLVAKGGFGAVYSGVHLTLQAKVAVKVLMPPDGKPRDGEAIARFLEEARTLSRLRHPHIVRVLDAGVLPARAGLDALPWLAMEWCEGRTLSADLRARAGRRRSVQETWRLVRPILAAIAYAHERGVVHRDLKPANIMVTGGASGDESPLIIDFGIAKNERSFAPAGTGVTETRGASVFTHAYAAPEQVAGARTGPWTDVHALGLIVTELLVGARPYGAEPEPLAVIDPDRPTPSRFGVSVGAWEEVLARAMALRPAQRFATAAELLAALARGIGEEVVPAAETGPRADLVSEGDLAVTAPRVEATRGTALEAPLLLAATEGHTGEPSSVETPPRAIEEFAAQRGRKRRLRIWAGAALAALSIGGGYAALRYVGSSVSAPSSSPAAPEIEAPVTTARAPWGEPSATVPPRVEPTPIDSRDPAGSTNAPLAPSAGRRPPRVTAPVSTGPANPSKPRPKPVSSAPSFW